MKLCSTCQQDRPHDAGAGRNTKASGFYGTKCWSCYLVWRKIPEIKAVRKAWINLPANRAKADEAIATWKQANRGQVNMLSRSRRAARLNRTPAWADHDLIKLVYVYADALGMTVDHVLPLQGKLVSGLHVYENLQLLTKSENVAKGNRFVPC